MSSAGYGWDDLIPAESKHEEVLAVFRNDPDRMIGRSEFPDAFRSSKRDRPRIQLAAVGHAIGEALLMLTCEQLVFEGRLEKRVEPGEDGETYYRLADSGD